MIKRISMWKLKSFEDVEEMKAALLSMKGKAPSLVDMEVGVNISQSKSAYDIVFVGLFEDEQALREFEVDAFHKSVGEVVDRLKGNRVVVDFEV